MAIYECDDCGDQVEIGRAAFKNEEQLESWGCLLCGGDMVEA